jgi:hypothetical protein
MTKSPAHGPWSGSRPVRPTPHDQHVDLLQAQLQRHLDWHRARLNFLAKALLALLSAGSANLTKGARAFRGPAQLDSHYKRLQRFLRGFDCLGDGRLTRLASRLKRRGTPVGLKPGPQRLAPGRAGCGLVAPD